jgi:hypothetical protein
VTDKGISSTAAFAILTLADIKAAIAAFDSGDSSAFDCLGTIVEVLASYRESVFDRSQRAAA